MAGIGTEGPRWKLRTISTLCPPVRVWAGLMVPWPLLWQEMTAQEEDRRKDLEAQEKHKKLFEGLKFFLNREVPREALAFVIRWEADGIGSATLWAASCPRCPTVISGWCQYPPLRALVQIHLCGLGECLARSGVCGRHLLEGSWHHFLTSLGQASTGLALDMLA